MSRVRQNFHEESEAGLNQQINTELSAMYFYMAMAAYYDRDDVALRNVAAFFRKSAAEEKSHAEALIEYQNKRGGRVVFANISAPPQTEFTSLLSAFTSALTLEKEVNGSLLALHKVADSHDDAQMTDFLEGNFLKEQVEAIRELAGYVANLRQVGSGLGEWMFDHEFEIGESK